MKNIFAKIISGFICIFIVINTLNPSYVTANSYEKETYVAIVNNDGTNKVEVKEVLLVKKLN